MYIIAYIKLSFELKISDISNLSISFVYQVILTDSFVVVTVMKLHKEYLSLDVNFFHILYSGLVKSFILKAY